MVWNRTWTHDFCYTKWKGFYKNRLKTVSPLTGTNKGEKCGKVIAERKELIRIKKR